MAESITRRASRNSGACRFQAPTVVHLTAVTNIFDVRRGRKESRFGGRPVVQLVTYNWTREGGGGVPSRALKFGGRLMHPVCAHPRVENKLRNAIAETAEPVERCGRILWEKETTVEMPVSVEGRASVNVQRLLEPLQMCRKRFDPGEKLSAAGILVTNGARFPARVRAGLRGAGMRKARRRSSFPNDMPASRIEIKIHRLLSFSQKIRRIALRCLSGFRYPRCLPNDVLLPLPAPAHVFAGPFCILARVCFGFTRKTALSEDKTQSTKIRYALPRSTLSSPESTPSALLPRTVFSSFALTHEYVVPSRAARRLQCIFMGSEVQIY